MKKLMIAAGNCAAMAVATLAAGTASAQVATSYTFTGVVAGDTTNSFNGSFSLLNTAGKYTLTAFSASYLTASFDLTNSSLFQSSSPNLEFGGNANGIAGQAIGTDDFFFEFNPGNIQTSPGFPSVVTTKTPFRDASLTFAQVPIVTPISSAVPEPATWGMIVLGMGAVGYAMRRRKARIYFPG